MDIELGRRGPERGAGLEGPRRGVQDQGNGGGGVGW